MHTVMRGLPVKEYLVSPHAQLPLPPSVSLPVEPMMVKVCNGNREETEAQGPSQHAKRGLLCLDAFALVSPERKEASSTKPAYIILACEQVCTHQP